MQNGQDQADDLDETDGGSAAVARYNDFFVAYATIPGTKLATTEFVQKLRFV